MTGAIAIICTFGLPAIIVWLSVRHKERMRRLELEAGKAKALPPGEDGKTMAELRERVAHLETIVCSVDFELNAKLNRLAGQQSQMFALSAAKDGSMAFDQTTALSGPAGALETGQRVADRFVVDRPLGAGGMGAVYLARDESLGEQVALKIIAGTALFDPAAKERFRREATAARRISHPNVVRLHDIGESEALLFLSMEYVPGPSLKELLERHGRLDHTRVRAMAAEICAGLAAAHEQGIVHRDLKPGNVLFDDQGRAKIIDFGLAQLPHIEGMTATGMIMGTPEYMAPEQIKGGSVDPRTDLYALGAVIFHAFTGRPPYRGDTPISVGLKQITEPLPPMDELPEGWAEVVTRAMSKDPAHRFESAQRMREALPS